MKSELEHKLCKRFPWLYAGYGGSIESEGLHFGLQHGDGWFNIIWMLSLALEEEYKKLYPWHKRLYHRIYMRIPIEWIHAWNDLMKKQPLWFQKKTDFGHLPRFYNYNWRPNYPRASQIKEKYGTLRYYMTCETDEMSKYIGLAEGLSSEVCEQCGKWGKTRGEYWLYTACEDHSKPEDLSDSEKEALSD